MRSKICGPIGSPGTPIDSRMPARLAVAALETAVARRASEGADVAGRIEHADRGSQFRSRTLNRALARHAMIGSMGQVGTLRGQRRHGKLLCAAANATSWTANAGTPRNQLRIAILIWIERTYHRRRRQPRLGKLTPIQYETIMPTAAPSGLTRSVTQTCSSPR